MLHQINLTIKFYCIIKQQILDFIIINKSIKIKVILYRYTLHVFTKNQNNGYDIVIILFIQKQCQD